jgi:predicted DNA-binding transcriptional regulator AlpA
MTVSDTKKIAAPQFAVAVKAAAPKADTRHAPRVHLLDKADVLAITGVTFPTVWSWMRKGKFPRSRIAGGKSFWRSDEVEQWLADLPVRPLKGDGEPAEAVP